MYGGMNDLTISGVDLLQRLICERREQALTGRQGDAVVARICYEHHGDQLRRPLVRRLQHTEIAYDIC